MKPVIAIAASESISTEGQLQKKDGFLRSPPITAKKKKKKGNLLFAGANKIFLKKIYSKRRYTRPEPHQTVTTFSPKRYKSHWSPRMPVS